MTPDSSTDPPGSSRSPRARHRPPASRLLAAVGALVVVCLSAPELASAQATSLERRAAAPILARIDSLQAELDLQGTAERLAGADDPDRDRVLARAGELWDARLRSLSDWIGRHPEVGFEEHRAADTLTAVLRDYGYGVDRGVAGLETAFVGTWTSPAGPDGPTLGVILEYDALRGSEGAFHGDQHNAQGPVAIAAAVAVQDYMEEEGLPGRVVAFGTPAEEVPPPPKATMYRAGVFDSVDVLVRSHGGRGTSRSRPGFGSCCLNIDAVKYTFHGRPAHQRQSWHGRNALTAAVELYTGVDHMRSNWRPEASIQGVIPEGGTAPNVVPERAVVDYYVRYPDEVYLRHITGMMEEAARGAARATGTEVSVDTYGRYRDGISLGTLEELSWAYAVELGAPERDPERTRPSGYEETGFVSRVVPGVGVNVHSTTAANHTHEMLEDGLSEIGHAAFRMDARIMAAVLYHYLADDEFRSKVDREHRALAGQFDHYLERLEEAYEEEMNITVEAPPEDDGGDGGTR